MTQPKIIEARCNKCAYAAHIGNKLYCSKEGLKRVFPYNFCEKFDRKDILKES